MRMKFFKGSAMLASMTVLAYGLGFLRDRLLAHAFGASQALSAYEQAFTIPDVLQNIFVASALTAAFVPIFSDLLNNSGRDESNDFLSSVLNGSLLMVGISAVIVSLFAGPNSHITVPGFDPVSRATYIHLMRLLLLSPMLFAISNTLGSILVTQQRFFWYGISTSLYNLGTIAGIVFLSSRWGVTGVVMGTLAGAVLHLASRIIGAARFGLRYRITLRFSDYYRRFLRLMAPKMMSQPIEQFSTLALNAIASTLGTGSIVVLTFAQNFQSAPISIIGITLATTAFPLLSQAAARGDRAVFRAQLRFALKMIVAIAVPAAILMYLLRHWIINLLLGGGHYSPEAVVLTAATLGVFTLSIITESVSHLLARAFYSLKNSVIPVTLSLLGLGITIATGYLFSRTMGVPGLALGFFVGSAVKMTLLAMLLRRVPFGSA